MLAIYLWSFLGIFVINTALIFIEDEFLEYLVARIIQWTLNLILSLLFFHATLGKVHFFVALLHQAVFSTLILALSIILPRIGEEYLGYGEPDEMGLGPWFLLVALLLSALWGGLPKLISLPGLKVLWNDFPGLLIFFLVGQIGICAFKTYLQEFFEQSLVANLIGSFLSLVFTLSLIFAIQEKLSNHGFELFTVSFVLVISSFVIWLSVPVASELIFEQGKLDGQTLKAGCLTMIIGFLIAGGSVAFSWFSSIGSAFNDLLSYFGF